MWKIRRSIACQMPPSGHLVRNSGMCLDWESNCQPFGLQASTQSTEPHQPGLMFFLIKRERNIGCERETLIGRLLVCALTGDWTHNMGMCPNQESNQQPFSLRDNVPTNWATPARAKHNYVFRTYVIHFGRMLFKTVLNF